MRRIVPMYSGICADVASISVEHNTKKSDVSPDVSRRSTVHRAAAGRTFLWDKVQQRTPGNHHRINPVRWMTWAPEPTGVWHLPDVAGLPRMMTRHDRTWGPPWDCGLLNGCLAVCFMEEMSGQCSWWQKHIYIYSKTTIWHTWHFAVNHAAIPLKLSSTILCYCRLTAIWKLDELG
jgi:hypothetical protein